MLEAKTTRVIHPIKFPPFDDFKALDVGNTREAYEQALPVCRRLEPSKFANPRISPT